MYRDTVGHEPNIHLMGIGAEESRGEAWRSKLLEPAGFSAQETWEDQGRSRRIRPESRLG